MIFIDTGAFLGRYWSQDQYHDQSVHLWNRIAERADRCFTSNFVLNEFFTLHARRDSYATAAERAQLILSSTLITVLRPGVDEEREAVGLFKKFADQQVSFADCISFVLMRQRRIQRAFSFDRHFILAGFECL